VMIIAILAVIASVAYRRWLKSSYLAEAQDMVSNIRVAENAFYSENGAYLNVTGTPASPQFGKGASYPSPNPGAFTTAWAGDCGTCNNPKAWQQLGIQASAPVRFGYSAIAGDGIKVAPSIIGSPMVNGKTLDYTNLTTPVQPWFFVEADANISGDGAAYMHVYAMSGTNQLFVDQEGN